MAKTIKFTQNQTAAPREDSVALKKTMYQAGVLFLVLTLGSIIFYLIQREKREKKREEVSQEALWHAQKYFEEKKYKKALHGDGFYVGFLAIRKKWGKVTKAGRLASYNIAEIYMQQKKYKKALKALEGLVLEDAILQSQLLVLRGDAYSFLGEKEPALRAYEAAAKCAPNPYTTPRALAKAAALFFEKGDLEGAKACYQRICDEFPKAVDYADSLKKLGYITGLLEKKNG